jgi:hypothetical protein
MKWAAPDSAMEREAVPTVINLSTNGNLVNVILEIGGIALQAKKTVMESPSHANVWRIRLASQEFGEAADGSLSMDYNAQNVTSSVAIVFAGILINIADSDTPSVGLFGGGFGSLRSGLNGQLDLLGSGRGEKKQRE